MNSLFSKPFAVMPRIQRGMLHLSVMALVLIASRPVTSDESDGMPIFEMLPPPAPMELLPPVLPQPEDDIAPQQGPTAPVVLPTPTPAQLHENPGNADRITDDVVDLMDRLKSQQHDLQRMGDRDSEMADLHAEVTQNSIDHSLRLQRIQDRIARLRALLEQRQNCVQTEPTGSNASTMKATAPNPVPEVRVTSPPRDIAVDPRDSMVEPRDSMVEPRDDPRSMASAFIVTEHAVDRLSLANNLFAAGQIDLAQRIYAELLTLEPGPNDRVWIEYQLANCYRRNGDIKQAEKLYRVVAGSTASLYWAERARWWMSNLARVQGYLDRQARLADSLDQIQETFDETSSL